MFGSLPALLLPGLAVLFVALASLRRALGALQGGERRA